MVFFTCNSCGESLKKNKVDKHLMQCRSKSISCVDCNKDFTDDYYLHNQCISEDQKYGGIDYKPKENSFKGKAKQEEWIQKVKTAINGSNSNKHIKDLMQRLVSYDNIPRKKVKFINFIRNSLHITNDYYGQQMWDIFEKAIKTDSESNTNDNTKSGDKRVLNDSDISQSVESKKFRSNDSESNDETNENNSTINDNSSISEEINDFNDTQNSETKSKLKINKIISEILQNPENSEISLKKLKKKVLKTCKSIDKNYSKDKIVSKFEKKINTNKKIVINEGKVSLK